MWTIPSSKWWRIHALVACQTKGKYSEILWHDEKSFKYFLRKFENNLPRIEYNKGKIQSLNLSSQSKMISVLQWIWMYNELHVGILRGFANSHTSISNVCLAYLHSKWLALHVGKFGTGPISKSDIDLQSISNERI